MSLETCNTQLSFLQKQITSLQEQLQQSEKNLNAQKEVMKIKRKVSRKFPISRLLLSQNDFTLHKFKDTN